MRAFAHLFGLFHLHQDKRLIQLKRDGKGFVFEVIKKNGSDREHKLYWKYLARLSQNGGVFLTQRAACLIATHFRC